MTIMEFIQAFQNHFWNISEYFRVPVLDAILSLPSLLI